MQMTLFGNPIDGPLTRVFLEESLSRERIEIMRREVLDIPLGEIFDVLERTASLFATEGTRFRQRAIAELPRLLGYSEEMVRLGLDALPEMLGRQKLRERLHALPSPHVLDGEFYAGHGRTFRALPVGLVCHVAAGNIFLGSVDSLVYGIITKNINVLKASSQDKVFPALFFEALAECDANRVVLPYNALLHWSRSDTEIEDFFKQRSDLLLVFGGAQAVEAWRNGVSGTTEVAAFGPKLSLGIVDGTLSHEALTAAAAGFALDVTLWEQRACTSCQNIFIEAGRAVDPFVEALVGELANVARSWPRAMLPLDESVEVLRERELAMWHAFERGGQSWVDPEGAFAVIVQKSRDVIDSPLNRTLFVNVVDSLDELARGNIQHLRHNLSTVGLAVPAQREHRLTEELSALGVLRFCPPGQMASANDERAPHDGLHLAPLLVRLVSYEGISPLRHGSDFENKKARDRILLSRLNTILATARRASFYERHLSGIDLPIRSLEEYARVVPLLEKAHILEHSPEKSSAMVTGPANDSYVFSAGGTTGAMKFVLYTHEEFRLSQRVFGQGFRNAGITERDVVANCFRAGAFWTAFLATNGGLEETGCRILSMSGNQSEAQTVEYLSRFQPNVLMGVSSHLLLIAQESERMGAPLSIERVGYAGEHLSPEAKAFLARIFKTRHFFSLGYAAVETGPIGFQCSYCQGTEHHPCDDWVYVEELSEGDIVVTTLERFLNPLVRFRVGDRIEWVREPCPCGRASPRFRLRERTDDLVMFAVSHLSLSDVSRILGGFPELAPVFRVVVEPRGPELALRFDVEVSTPSPGLETRVIESLRTHCRCLGPDAARNAISHIGVTLHSPGGIERVERTGKVRRVVDGRAR